MSDNLTENKKYKVLLFGHKVVGTISFLYIDYCDVTICRYPYEGEYERLKRLSEYDLIVLDYAAFRSTDISIFEIFDKQVSQALELGTSICFLHYNEEIPDYDTDSQFKYSLSWQIGLRWVLKIGTSQSMDFVSHAIEIKRQEFKNFGENWGTSKTFIEPFDDSIDYDEIFLLKENISGLVYQYGKGKVIFLPCQRDLSRSDDLENCLTILVNSILNYLKKIAITLPDWAETPMFQSESKVYEELQQAKAKISELENSLEPFQIAKSLPFLREYNFEEAIPKFLENNIGLPVLRNDIFKEDFWILDTASEKQVICETKTYLRGLKKAGIYNLFTHRDSNNLDEDFPALLIVNPHTIANSWKEKIQPIPPQEYKLAVTNNVLIMRVEDLLFFWNLIIEGKKTKEELFSLIISEKGWLEVTKEGDVIPHK